MSVEVPNAQNYLASGGKTEHYFPRAQYKLSLHGRVAPVPTGIAVIKYSFFTTVSYRTAMKKNDIYAIYVRIHV